MSGADVLLYLVYHIHQFPVPADGNCTATVAHLDPTQRGELHACEVVAPQTCQAGDLAGKHGNITTSPTFSATFTDNYLSTTPGSPYYFGDKSIVIHSSNATRLTCANFQLMSGSSNTTNGTAPSGTGAPMPTGSPFMGGATVNYGTAGVVTGLIAELQQKLGTIYCTALYLVIIINVNNT